MLRVLQALFVIFLILLFGWRTQAMEARLSIPPNFADDISLSADMTAASSFKVVQSKIKEECSVKLSSDHEKKGGAILGEIERVLEQFYCAKAVPATEANSCGNISPKSYNWSVVVIFRMDGVLSEVFSIRQKVERFSGVTVVLALDS